ncbi:MAG: hypothetical protein WCX73_01045 [Candidatus Pacearchaeota archaeon]|jgi:hypothetical protein
MGFSYAGDALVLIVADSNGLTKEEIFEINKKTYQSTLEHYFGILTDFESGLSQRSFIEKRDDEKYHIRKDVDMQKLQNACRLGAQIGFGLCKYRPKFWKGKIFDDKDVPGDG